MIPLAALLAIAAQVPAQAPNPLDTTPPKFLAAPVFTPAPNASTPLAGRLQVENDEPTRIFVDASDGAHTWRFAPSEVAGAAPTFSAAFATHHDLALVGFHAGTTNTLRITAFDRAGNRSTWPVAFTFTTPLLPHTMPVLHVTASHPELMEPGVTLTAMYSSAFNLPTSGNFVVFLDAVGQVIWLHQSSEALGYNVTRLRDGHLLMNVAEREARVIDLLGNTVGSYWAARTGTAGMPAGAIPVDCDNFHHELRELPLGYDADFVALSHEMRTYPNYPVNEVDLTQTQPLGHVVGDEVVEFLRSGAIVRRISLLDVLDPYRLCYDSLAPVGAWLYGVDGGDWSHANAIEYDPADGDWIVSLRNQDAVVKIDRQTGALRWILGPHERWNPPWSQHLLTSIPTSSGAPFEWSYHQHSPHFDANGDLDLFDNGNYRVTPPTPPGPPDQFYSRAVRFRVDASAMTVRQMWQYDGSNPGGASFIAKYFGDADPLRATGNVLVTDGWKKVPGANRTYGRIAEVTNAAPSAPVFEVIVNDPATSNNPYNWNLYHSRRYPSINP